MDKNIIQKYNLKNKDQLRSYIKNVKRVKLSGVQLKLGST